MAKPLEVFSTHLDIIFVELNGGGSVSDRITIGLEFDVCLRPIAVERRILVVFLYRLGVIIYRGGPVVPSESLVALDLERGCVGFVCGRGCGHVVREAPEPEADWE